MTESDPLSQPIRESDRRIAIDIESKREMGLYFRDQRSLIEKQEQYSKAIKQATWVMAIASAIIAIATLAQYFVPLR